MPKIGQIKIHDREKIYIYIYITVNRLLLLNRSLIVEHCSGSNGELPGFVYIYIYIYIYNTTKKNSPTTLLSHKIQRS